MIPKIPKFATQKETFAWLKEHQDDILYAKKSEFKMADGFCASVTHIQDKTNVQKTTKSDTVLTEVKVRAVINTTYIRDSHKDVHIDGLWNKTLKENTRIKHIQEHQMKFDKIIADKNDLKAFAKTYEWKELGYDIEGTTEALVFDSLVKESRNSTMFKEYRDKNVDNHSVGMYYVKIKFAMNSSDEDDKQLKAEYDKHIDKIANKEEVEKDGYFWAVYEAKAIEGSAVLLGSNPITPTLDVNKEDIEVEDKMSSAIKEWLRS
jgi:hypothetical protein